MMEDAAGPSPAKVLIAGGGIAGLEALMALSDLAGERVQITLLAPDPDFTYRPMLVEEPFSSTPAERHELAPLVAEHGGRFVQQALARMRPEEHVAELADGSRIEYDLALICVGAPTHEPFRGAVTFRTSGAPPIAIDDLLRAAAAHPTKRLALVVPSGVTWALPVYEVALMAERRARDLELEVELVIVTPEAAPLVMFGTIPSDAVAALLKARGIAFRPSTHAHEEDGGLLLTPGNERLEAGSVIALPALSGPEVPGLPADEGGFIPIDEYARVPGVEDVYAAGDGTNFPIKQGGLGTQQADAAAEHIAARLGAEVDPQPFRPVLRGKLITSEESLHMRADVAGGEGEGVASEDYLWWPPHKVAGRYLTAWLGEAAEFEPEPPARPVEVEVSLPHEWHREPMALDPYEPMGSAS